MKVKWLFYFAAAFLFLLLIAGCGSSQFPTGEFTSQLEGRQILLRFDGDGNFTILRDGRDFAQGTYSVDGNQLTWLTDSSCASPNGETPIYSWVYEDQTLIFSLLEKDSCMSRLYMLEKLPYEKIP